MTTSKREFPKALERAREFQNGKSTAGYNVGAERHIDKNDFGTVWTVFWGTGFLDPETAVAR